MGCVNPVIKAFQDYTRLSITTDKNSNKTDKDKTLGSVDFKWEV